MRLPDFTEDVQFYCNMRGTMTTMVRFDTADQAIAHAKTCRDAEVVEHRHSMRRLFDTAAENGGKST